MTESILQIKDLKKSFGDNQILKGISLDVKQGEVVVILGSSGCGKSTLLRCINGLETIQGGDILLDGKSITGSKKDFHLIRQKIGMVFQSYDLFPHLDILQNLILGPVKAQRRNKDEVIAEAEKLLDRVGLLGTKYTMTQDFYKGKLAEYGVEVLIPEASEIETVNRVIYGELCRGILSETSKEAYLTIIAHLKERGAQGVILGCTEIGLLVKSGDTDVPLFDTALIHAEKAAELSVVGDTDER